MNEKYEPELDFDLLRDWCAYTLLWRFWTPRKGFRDSLVSSLPRTSVVYMSTKNPLYVNTHIKYVQRPAAACQDDDRPSPSHYPGGARLIPPQTHSACTLVTIDP